MNLKHIALLAALFGAASSSVLAQAPATAPATQAKPAAPMTTTTPAPTTPTAPAPKPAPATSTSKAPVPAAHSVNINTASAAQLDALPQIGEKRAAKIIQNRPYKSVDELVSKKVLSQGVFNKIKDYITN
jgi:DNA uptake protein ComE-like DNA-binding protein